MREETHREGSSLLPLVGWEARQTLSCRSATRTLKAGFPFDQGRGSNDRVKASDGRAEPAGTIRAPPKGSKTKLPDCLSSKVSGI